MWQPFEEGRTVGRTGSEGGVIQLDDEHDRGARITLESGCLRAPFAITCGVYGWMAHTRFLADRESADHAIAAMKAELEQIVLRLPLDDEQDLDFDDLTEAVAAFVEQFP